MDKRAAVIGTFDTKGEEFLMLIRKLKDLQVDVITIDTGLGKNESFEADYSAALILKSEGYRMDEIASAEKRAEYLEKTAEKAAQIVLELSESGKARGAISMGGGQGSFIAGIVMRALPIGFPKVLLSTIALVESSAKQFKNLNDTVVMNSLVDISGCNSLLEMTISEAAGCIAGMLENQTANGINSGKPAVGISAWGVTTPCVNMVRSLLEADGIEVYVFHSNGDGGMVLENLIRQGALCAVADLTLPEISMPLAGACVSPIPHRLENAGEAGIPQVVAPGGLDMVLASADQLAAGGRFYNRKVYQHNPQVAFVRSSPDENKAFGKAIADKLNHAKGPVKLLLPLEGLSAIDKKGEIFYDPQTNQVLFDTLTSLITNNRVEILEADSHINSRSFAEAVVKSLKEISPELNKLEEK